MVCQQLPLRCAGTLPANGDYRDGYYLGRPDAEPVALPPLPNDSWVDVYSINDSRVIIGRSRNLIDGSTAVVWRPMLDDDGTVTIDVPCLSFPLRETHPQSRSTSMTPLLVDRSKY